MIGARTIMAALCLSLGAACLAKAAYIPAKAALAGVLIERAFDRSQAAGAAALPWASMDARPLARLSVPRLGASEIVLDAETGQALAFAPAHMQQTVRPGAPGLSVIAAHKNTHFAFLQDLQAGDIVTVEAITGEVTAFKISAMEIVDKTESGIDVSASVDAPRIALVTCYPFDALSYGGPLRYVVYGEKA